MLPSNSVASFQTGARHDYAIPTALQRQGLLSYFLTDFALRPAMASLVRRFQFGSRQKRLLNRAIPAAIAPFTHSPFQLGLATWRRHRSDYSPEAVKAWEEAIIRETERTCPSSTKVAIGHYLEGVAFIGFLRERGIHTVMEVFIAPQAARLVREENERYPEVADRSYDRLYERELSEWPRAIASTDFYLAPSDFVVTGLLELGIPAHLIRVVPYGVPNSFFNIHNTPTPKRVLFTGTADLRKGIHYVAQAANELADRGYEFRVAGGATKEVISLLRRNRVTFLGRIPKSDTLSEYANADVLILPSIAEGSATVVYEAMAAGVPVITTTNAGSLITSEVDGLLVPVGDGNSLTQAVRRICENRELRDKLASAAKSTAHVYTSSDYGDRFIKAIKSLLEQHAVAPKTIITRGSTNREHA